MVMMMMMMMSIKICALYWMVYSVDLRMGLPRLDASLSTVQQQQQHAHCERWLRGKGNGAAR